MSDDDYERGITLIEALRTELAEAQRQLDGVQREWAHRGTRLRTVANERDALAAKVEQVRRYVLRVPFPKLDKVLAILDAAPEPESGESK
jgi:hypothetical protein